MSHQFAEQYLLSELRQKIESSSQKEVAKKLRLTPQYINDVLHNRRSISPKLAKGMGYKRIVVFEKLKG